MVFDEVQVNDSKRYRVSSWGGGKAPGKIRLEIRWEWVLQNKHQPLYNSCIMVELFEAESQDVNVVLWLGRKGRRKGNMGRRGKG